MSSSYSDTGEAAPWGDAGIPAGWLLRHLLNDTVDPPRPEGGDGTSTGADRFAVRVIDNPVNTYQQVMGVCSEALGIPFDAAFEIARTIDTTGSCVVCVAARAEAERVATHIATIGIEVRLEPAAPPAAGA